MNLVCMFNDNLDDVYSDVTIIPINVTICIPAKTKEALEKCVIPMSIPGIIVTDGVYTHPDAVENTAFYLDYPDRLKEAETPYVETTLRVYTDLIPKIRALAQRHHGKFTVDLNLNSSFKPASAMTEDHTPTINSVSLYSFSKTPLIGGPKDV